MARAQITAEQFMGWEFGQNLHFHTSETFWQQMRINVVHKKYGPCSQGTVGQTHWPQADEVCCLRNIPNVEHRLYLPVISLAYGH